MFESATFTFDIDIDEKGEVQIDVGFLLDGNVGLMESVKWQQVSLRALLNDAKEYSMDLPALKRALAASVADFEKTKEIA